MKLSDIKNSGMGAARLITVVSNIKNITNVYAPDYFTAIENVRAIFNDPLLTFSTMTDNQINTYWLNGLGDAASIATAKEVCIEWELCILQVKSSADKFINDI